MKSLLFASIFAAGSALAASPAYVPAGTVALGAPDRWDYVVFEPVQQRVYVAHGDRVAVVDARSMKLLGEVKGIAGGTHGTAVSIATGQGFTDDGKAGQVVAYDLKTLAVKARIPVDDDADAMALDPVTGHVFVAEGDPGKVQVIDPKTNKASAIPVGEKLEYIAADGQGAVFVAGEEKRDLVRIDARTGKVTAHVPTPDCVSPHGLALDPAGCRAFMSCVNGLIMVIDTQAGRVVAELPIGKGSDAAGFDPVKKRVFSSNGADGTISVYRQVTPDRYEALEPVHTLVSARTMAVDPATGRLFTAGADTDPPATPGARPKPKAGTLRLMAFSPAP